MKKAEIIQFDFAISRGADKIKEYTVFCMQGKYNCTEFYITSNSDLHFIVGFNTSTIEDFDLEEYVDEMIAEWIAEWEEHDRALTKANELRFDIF